MRLPTWPLFGVLTLVVGLPACAAPSATIEENTATIRQPLGEAVATDKASYVVGETVVVSFNSLPGNTHDWVALSPVGSPATQYTRWAYTLGATNGSISFAAPPAGDYVARAYEDNSYSVLAESAPITIATQNAQTSITLSATSFTTSETAHVGFTGMAGYETDWISIAPQGSPAEGYVRWAYTHGQLDGTAPFALQGLSGTFVARAHFQNGYDIAAESDPFTVTTSGTSAARDKASYGFGETVSISYANMRGTLTDWVGVARAGAPATDCAWWAYTHGNLAGALSVDSLPAGTYVVRTFFEDSYVIESESESFTVASPTNLPVTLSTDKTNYTGLEPVHVTFNGMQGTPTDWIATGWADYDMTWYSGWTYTNGQTSGSATLNALPRGTWVIRAFFEDGFTVRGQMATTIHVSTVVETDKSTYAPGEPVTVRYGGMSRAKKDWIGISAGGAPASAFYLYRYTEGWPAGTDSFDLSSLGPGTYVARAYFNDQLTIEAESAAFTIAP